MARALQVVATAAAMLGLCAGASCGDDTVLPLDAGTDAAVGGDASMPTPDASADTVTSDVATLPDAGSDALPDASTVVPCDGAACDWTQWAHDPQHTGSTPVVGQMPGHLLAQFVFDPFLTLEQAESSGDLLAHYQTPLLVGDDVYMLSKAGQYISCQPPGSGHLADGGACGAATWCMQTWSEVHFHWEARQLVQAWTFTSDWEPEPAQLSFGWEPVFQPAVSGAFLYVPGAGGALWKVDRLTGLTAAHIQPFGATASDSIYVSGGLTVDGAGNVLYNAIQLDPLNPFNDATGWLVRVTPSDVATTATYASLVPDAPAPTSLCDSAFDEHSGFQRPYPPAPLDGGAQVLAPPVPCLSQRPGLNAQPAVGADGTIFTVSRAHGEALYSYVVAVNPDLTPKWDASLRNRIDDGCGVLVPSQASPTADGGVIGYGCRVGATVGVDPDTNEPPAPWVDDPSSSSPIALPDGTVAYGASSAYNTDRGHLMHFAADGGFLGSFDFGWDVTPAVYAHGGTYSLVVKDNHYFNWGTSTVGPYWMTSLSAALAPEWTYDNSNTSSCSRGADGGIACVSDHPDSFEWCVNAPAIDGRGLLYANSEDGNMYVLDATGHEVTHAFLQLSLGAAYTPIALDHQGRIYALNAGVMRVLGQ
jgi:hypothetical protein